MSSVKGHALESDEDKRDHSVSVLLLMIVATTAVGVVLILSALLAYPTTRLTQRVVAFDQDLIVALNRTARLSYVFDLLVRELTATGVYQGAMAALFCGVWFGTSDDALLERRRRARMLTSLIGLYLGLVLTTVLRIVLPFRSRPAQDLTFILQVPYSLADTELGLQSTSFPSGHAAVFFALAVGVWTASNRLGILASLYALVVICIPRIYIGRHYPTDIAAGAVLGVGIVLLTNELLSRSSFTTRVVAWSQRHGTVSGFLLFVSCLDIATDFSSVRGFLRLLLGGANRLVMLAGGSIS